LEVIMNQRVYAIATMDTKGHEIAFVAERLRAAGVNTVTVDVGTLEPPGVAPDVDRSEVLACDPDSGAGHPVPDRAGAIAAMSRALSAFLIREHAVGRVAAVCGIGGSGGTDLITRAMRCLPVGLPKLMVSTVASGNTAPYVGLVDVTMMHSVVDIAGLNAVSRRVLANAAAAVAGMVGQPALPSDGKPAIAMTMFGVTTPCVTAVRSELESRGFDCLVFHATGTGGKAMETLIKAGLIEGVLDITTTEVADLLVGGILPCGPDRFEPILRARVPLILSLGALDMVNFGALDTVPDRFCDRLLHVHNAQVTLMRTTPDENRVCARWIAAKLNRSDVAFCVLIPEGGVSALDAPGGPFYDPIADAALFEELEATIEPAPNRRVRRVPLHINDPAFADALVQEFLQLYQAKQNPAGPRPI
jgi:uncharacterized protein (UPF0261 family)